MLAAINTVADMPAGCRQTIVIHVFRRRTSWSQKAVLFSISSLSDFTRACSPFRAECKIFNQATLFGEATGAQIPVVAGHSNVSSPGPADRSIK